MAYIDFLTPVHKATKRDYLARVNEYPKAKASVIAKRFDYDFWDGDRKFGYGGYKYDGRWKQVAEPMIQHFGLKAGDSVLDVGCGKAHLLYEMKQLIPDLKIQGLDISRYAIENTLPEIQEYLQIGNVVELPFEDDSFDLVLSINAIHNLYCYDLERAIREIERVGRRDKYICVESYRNEEERENLFYWILTAECFFTPEEWQWWHRHCNYTGDHSFIYFE